MTPIEDLVRQALAATPTAPAGTDPLAALDRRVRRARRRLVAGAGVVAATVVAAVVVPLAVLGGNGSPNGVGVVNPVTPAPAPLPSGATALWTDGAVSSATDSSGQRWVLYKEGEHNYLQPIGAGTDKLMSVDGPADYLVAGDGVLWVVGTASGEPGDSRSLVTAIDIRTGDKAELEQTQVSGAAAVDRSLYVIEADTSGGYVARIDFDHNGLGDIGEVVLPGAQEIVVTAKQHIWVHAGRKLVELTPTPGGFTVEARVDWGDGAILAPTLLRSGPDGVWADGGRLIALNPIALGECISCAEGYRVFVAGRPSAALETGDGLFVAIPGSGLDYYSVKALGLGNTPVTASVDNIQVVSLSPDPAGGVDYVDDQGQLVHWDPARAGSR